MRTIFVILLLMVTIFAKSQMIPEDKQQHFIAGTAIGFWASVATVNKKPMVSLAWSVGASTVIGAGKEIIYDKWMGKGVPEFKDALWTTIGGVAGFGLVQGFKWICHRNHKWKYRRIPSRINN
jgi:hypothetical protein